MIVLAVFGIIIMFGIMYAVVFSEEEQFMILEECVLLAIFTLLIIACIGVIAGISYVFYQISEGKEITIKMEEVGDNEGNG